MSSSKKTRIGCVIVLLLIFVAILAVIVINAVQSGCTGTAAASNARAIARAYQAYEDSDPHQSLLIEAKPGDTVHTVAFLLAKDARLNDATVWLTRNDPKYPNYKYHPFSVLADNDNQRINPEFANMTLSFEIAANLAPNANPTTTPVLWTRGLRDDGTWAKNSPYKGEGGYIAYLDGHAEWVDGKLSVVEGGTCLAKYGANTPTVNIHEALPPGAVILSAEPNGAQR